MRDGAERDFAEFYAATWPRTLAVTYALTGDRGAAEELAQEAYVKAWSHWDQVSTLRPAGGLGAPGGDPARGEPVAAEQGRGGVARPQPREHGDRSPARRDDDRARAGAPADPRGPAPRDRPAPPRRPPGRRGRPHRALPRRDRQGPPLPRPHRPRSPPLRPAGRRAERSSTPMSDLDQLDPRSTAPSSRSPATSPTPTAPARPPRWRPPAPRVVRRWVPSRSPPSSSWVAGSPCRGCCSPRTGSRPNGGSARLDTAAFGEATEGWIGEWETWERYSPWGGGSFSGSRRARTAASRAASRPRSRRAGEAPASSATPSASAVFIVTRYGDADVAAVRVRPRSRRCRTTLRHHDDVRRRRRPGAPRLDAAGGRLRLRHVDGRRVEREDRGRSGLPRGRQRHRVSPTRRPPRRWRRPSWPACGTAGRRRGRRTSSRSRRARAPAGSRTGRTSTWRARSPAGGHRRSARRPARRTCCASTTGSTA